MPPGADEGGCWCSPLRCMLLAPLAILLLFAVFIALDYAWLVMTFFEGGSGVACCAFTEPSMMLL